MPAARKQDRDSGGEREEDSNRVGKKLRSESKHVPAADGAGVEAPQEPLTESDIISKLVPLFEEYGRNKALAPREERVALTITCIANMMKVIKSNPLLYFKGDMIDILLLSKNTEDFKFFVRKAFIVPRTPLDKKGQNFI